jgi:hypothetical protein
MLRERLFALAALAVVGAAGCGQPGADGEIDEVQGAVATTAQAVNCNGPATGYFVADQGFTGGGTIKHADQINMTKIGSSYPMEVFQTGRTGNFYYTFGPYPANWPVNVDLLFAETYFTQANKRQFNVSINGTQVLNTFDIFQQAGGKDIAIQRTFGVNSDAMGFVKIQFSNIAMKDQSLVSGILVIPNRTSI